MSNFYNILAVDDVEDWLMFYNKFLVEMFQNDSYKYSFELNAQNGVKTALKNKNYDLIITDLEMEHFSDEYCAGEWLLKNLVNKNEFIKTKFIIISGRYDIKAIADKFNVEFIPKDLLLSSPILFHYKVMELLNLTK